MEGKKIDLKDYDQIKEKYQRLILTESQLNNELDSVLSQSNKIINQLATIDASIEKKLEEIEMAKKTENLINEDKLHQKCKDIIDKFLIDVSQREVGVELQIRIQYNQMKISKTITDDNMTFAKLKEETKVQFGKDANEFFFCDESGSIKAGHSGYIIYSLLSYFFSYIFIRGCVIGFCYLTYRNQYIQALFELAKKRKEEKIADRIKKKEEERKIQEEWVKNNLQQHHDEKEIEMIKF